MTEPGHTLKYLKKKKTFFKDVLATIGGLLKNIFKECTAEKNHGFFTNVFRGLGPGEKSLIWKTFFKGSFVKQFVLDFLT